MPRRIRWDVTRLNWSIIDSLKWFNKNANNVYWNFVHCSMSETARLEIVETFFWVLFESVKKTIKHRYQMSGIRRTYMRRHRLRTCGWRRRVFGLDLVSKSHFEMKRGYWIVQNFYVCWEINFQNRWMIFGIQRGRSEWDDGWLGRHGHCHTVRHDAAIPKCWSWGDHGTAVADADAGGGAAVARGAAGDCPDRVIQKTVHHRAKQPLANLTGPLGISSRRQWVGPVSRPTHSHARSSLYKPADLRRNFGNFERRKIDFGTKFSWKNKILEWILQFLGKKQKIELWLKSGSENPSQILKSGPENP